MKEYYTRLLSPQKRGKRTEAENSKISRAYALLLFSGKDFAPIPMTVFSRSDYDFFDEMMDIKRFKNVERLQKFFRKKLTMQLDFHHWKVLQMVMTTLPTENNTVMLDLIAHHLQKLDGVTPSYGFFSSLERAYHQINTNRFDSMIEGLKRTYTSRLHKNCIYRLELAEQSRVEKFVNERIFTLETIPGNMESEPVETDTLWKVVSYTFNVDLIPAVTLRVQSLFNCLENDFRDFDMVIHDWTLSNKKFAKRWKLVVQKTQGEFVIELKKMITRMSEQDKREAVQAFVSEVFSIDPNAPLRITRVMDNISKYQPIFEYVTRNRLNTSDLNWKTMATLRDAYAETLATDYSDDRNGKLIVITISFYERLLMDCAASNDSIETILDRLELKSQEQTFEEYFELFYSRFVNSAQELIISENHLSNSVMASIPMLMDVLSVALESNSLYFERIILILCGLIRLKLLKVEEIKDPRHLRIFAKMFEKVDQLSTNVQHMISNSFESLFERCQFLLDLCSSISSNEKLHNVCNRVRYNVHEALLLLQKLIYSTQTNLNEPLLVLLRVENNGLQNVKFTRSNESYQLVLAFRDRTDIYTQISDFEYDAICNGMSLVTSLDSSIHTQKMLSIGQLHFLCRSNTVTLHQSVHSSTRKDPMQHLQTMFAESAFLHWKEETKIKTKSGVKTVIETVRLYDNDYYATVEKVIKQVAKLSAIGWIIGLSNRTQDTLAFDLKQFCFLELGFWSESSLIPFRMTSDVKRMISSLKNGRKIFDETLMETLKSSLQNRGVLFAMISIFLKNGCTSLVKKTKRKIKVQGDLIDVGKIVQDTIRDKSGDEIAHFEPLRVDQDSTLGDPYLLKLMQRKEKLIKELSRKTRQVQEEQMNITYEQDEEKEVDMVDHVPILQVSDPKIVLQRLLWRMNKWVAISSLEKDGMIHVETIEELAKTLKEQSENEAVLSSKPSL